MKDWYLGVITSNPKKVLLVLGLITLVMGSGLLKLTTRNNDDAELPAEDQIVKTNQEFSQTFGDKHAILVSILAEDLFKPSTLEKIKRITEALKDVPNVIEDEITSLATAKQITSNEEGDLVVQPYLGTVPQTAEDMATLAERVRQDKLVMARIVSKDERATLIIANIQNGYDQASVHQAVETIIKQYQGPEQIMIAGDPILSEEIDQGIERDAKILAPLALALQLLGFFLSFGRFRGVFLPFLTILTSIIWTLGFMGHAGIPMTVVTTSLPILLAVVASSYGIHAMHGYYRLSSNLGAKARAKAAFLNVCNPIFIAGLTSAIGSLTLIIFKVTSIREFGVATAAGILFATGLSLSLIPAFLTLTHRKEPKRVKEPGFLWLDRYLISLVKFCYAHYRLVLASTLVILAVAITGTLKVRPGADFIEYFPKSHSMRRTFTIINEKFGGARYFNVMIEGREPGALKDPQLLQKIEAFQKYVSTIPEIGYAHSIVDVIRRINLVMNENNPNFERIPDSRSLIAQYILLYAMAGNPADFNELVDYDFQRAKIRIMVKTSEQDDHKRIYAQLKSHLDAAFAQEEHAAFGGLLMVWLAQMKYIIKGKIENIVLSTIIILVVCMAIFRAVSLGVFCILPLTLATISTFGLMGFLGIRLEVGTAIITAMAVGIGVDFAIHFMSHLKEECRQAQTVLESLINTISITGKAIIFDVISNLLGFSVFIFSDFLPIQYFGWLISLTMITTGLATFILIPAMAGAFPQSLEGLPCFENQHRFETANLS